MKIQHQYAYRQSPTPLCPQIQQWAKRLLFWSVYWWSSQYLSAVAQQPLSPTKTLTYTQKEVYSIAYTKDGVADTANRKLIEYSQYNKKGKVVERKIAGLSGEIITYYYKYAPNGSLLQLNTYTEQGQPLTTWDYAYNAQHKITEESQTANNTNLLCIQYIYDKNSYLIEKYIQRTENDNPAIIKYTYNAKHQLVEEKTSDDNRITTTTQYIYDAKGRLSSEQTHNTLQKTTQRIEKQYAPNDSLLLERQIGANGIIIQEKRYEYDKKGRKKQELIFQKDILVQKIAFTYDTKNRLIEKILYSTADNPISKLVYQYR